MLVKNEINLEKIKVNTTEVQDRPMRTGSKVQSTENLKTVFKAPNSYIQ